LREVEEMRKQSAKVADVISTGDDNAVGKLVKEYEKQKK